MGWFYGFECLISVRFVGRYSLTEEFASCGCLLQQIEIPHGMNSAFLQLPFLHCASKSSLAQELTLKMSSEVSVNTAYAVGVLLNSTIALIFPAGYYS